VKKRFILFILLHFLFVLNTKAQVYYAPDTLQDDPILAALDSLNTLNLFEKGFANINYPKVSKYKFAPDSVPRYSELIYESRLAKLDASSPFDLQHNAVVQQYIDMYTLRKRNLVARLMALTQLYFPLFEEQLDKYNLPLELKYLAICESALNPTAKSRSGAMGLWQFMYPTGKIYGLQVNSYLDERCDPVKSTIAACEYFKYLYGLFHDWQMVLAAYNCGPGNLNRAIRRSGGKKTYWEIRPYLPKETQGYVPAFIAVNYVMNYTAEHNMYSAIPKKTFLQVDTIHIRKQLSFEQLSNILDIPIDEMQFLNPSYRKRVIPFIEGEPSILTLPADKIGKFVSNEEVIYNFNKKDSISSAIIIAKQEISKIHIVKKGEHLSTIARKYNCTVADLKTWNNIKSATVKPGKKLTVYVIENKITANAPAQLATKENTKPTAELAVKGGFKYYTIQKGDSLYKIATRNKTTVDEIKRLNNFGAKYNLLPGQKIKVGSI
jgi:membrane-bound lytic murein transglycosylase D